LFISLSLQLANYVFDFTKGQLSSLQFSGNFLYRIYIFIDDTHTATAFGIDKFDDFRAYFNFTNLSDDHFSILKAQLPEQMGGTGPTEKMGTML